MRTSGDFLFWALLKYTFWGYFLLFLGFWKANPRLKVVHFWGYDAQHKLREGTLGMSWDGFEIKE